jgi:hypothetical protein
MAILQLQPLSGSLQAIILSQQLFTSVQEDKKLFFLLYQFE